MTALLGTSLRWWPEWLEHVNHWYSSSQDCTHVSKFHTSKLAQTQPDSAELAPCVGWVQELSSNLTLWLTQATLLSDLWKYWTVVCMQGAIVFTQVWVSSFDYDLCNIFFIFWVTWVFGHGPRADPLYLDLTQTRLFFDRVGSQVWPNPFTALRMRRFK